MNDFSHIDAQDEISRLAQVQPEEPTVDDSVKFCPDCERPNQFGELCDACRHERQINNDLNDPMP